MSGIRTITGHLRSVLAKGILFLYLGFAVAMAIKERSIEAFFAALITPCPIVIFVLLFGIVPLWAGHLGFPWFVVGWFAEFALVGAVGKLAGEDRAKAKVMMGSTYALIGVLNFSMNLMTAITSGEWPD